MCGIAGYVLARGRAEQSTVERMCDQIRYRGPNDSGYYVDGRCALGMRRLSIIDLAGGHQPIPNEDRSLWVVYNGEVYNYQDLHRDLTDRGHRFTTMCDTETLLHLHEEEGVGGLHRLRGMFAYALWDSRREELLLVRDRFGKKPLYYAHLPEGLFFASEIKSLRAAGIPLPTDPEALKLYFLLGYVPDPYSAYQTVRKLEPGSWLLYRADGTVTRGRYWNLPVPEAHEQPGFSADDACQRLRQTFDEAVRLRLIADVPLGAFLSGGIDSSLVVASMARQSPDPVKTFSIGFEESAYNELQYASLVAHRYATEHHELMVRPDSVSLVEKLVHHFDEPFADSSAIPTYLVSEFAAQHVTVALSGDGGDELFAGYTRFQTMEKLLFMDRVPAFLRAGLAALAQWLPFSAYGKNYLHMLSRSSPMARYFESNFSNYYMRQQLLATGMDAPGRLRVPDANVAGCFFAPDCRPGVAGTVLRDCREPARRHARQGGPHVHGRLARSALPASRSSRGRSRCVDPHLLENPRGPRQVHSGQGAGRYLAARVAHAPEDGVRRAARILVPGSAARHATGSPHQFPISGAGDRFPRLCASSAR